MSNYSDDVRLFDDDPRSPFYKDPGCDTCNDDTGLCSCEEDLEQEREELEREEYEEEIRKEARRLL